MRYHCGTAFDAAAVRPLFSACATIGVVRFTNKEVRIVAVTGSVRQILTRLTVNLGTATRRGGQSANRIARLHDSERFVLHKKIVAATERHLADCGTVVLAGPRARAELLQHAMKRDTLVVVCDHACTLSEIIERSLPLMKSVACQEEAQCVQRLRRLQREQPDRLCYGREEVQAGDKAFMLSEVMATKEAAEGICNSDVRVLLYSSVLDDYDGCIGIKYY